MRKWIAFVLVLFLSFVLIGCGEKPGPCPVPPTPVPPTETITPNEIKISGEKAEINVGEEFDLTIEVLPADAQNKNVRVVANPSGIVEIIDNKTIKGLKAGEVTITINSIASPTVKKEFNLKVIGEEAPKPEDVKPTKLEINALSNEVQVGKTLSLSITPTPENAVKTVTWESSDSEVATINSTNGILLAKKEGKVTITATSTVDEAVKATIEITVIANNDTPITIEPTSIIVEVSAEEVEAGYKLYAKATVEPNGADQNVVWESRSPDVATIDEKGVIVGIKEGTTYIQAISKVNSEVKSSRIKIKVTPNTDPTTYPDMKGYTIVIMNAESALADHDPFLDGYTEPDKMYKQQAWNEVEKLYNCEISVQAYPTEAPWGTARIQWINNQAELGEAKADFYTISTAWMPDIASVGSAHDAKVYYQKYGKNQMEITLKQACTFRGGLYGLSTGPNDAKNYTDIGLYYNLGWVEKLKLESPAKLFNEGKWTYSTFVKWVNDCQALLGEGQFALAGHYYYYWLGMTNAAGVKIANTAAVNATLTHPRSKAIVEILKGFVATGALSTTTTWMEESGEFLDGECVMTTGSWWFVKTDNRWRKDLWGEDTRFGYVPFPYPDDMSKDQTRIGAYGTTMLLFASGRDSAHPAGVTYEDVYQAMTIYYLKAARYYSEDPSYDAENIKRMSISSKIDDPESVEAAMWWNNSNCFYDAAHDFYTSIATSPVRPVIISIINSNKDYDQAMGELEGTYLKKFYDTYSSN